MTDQERAERLRLALICIGALFTIGFYPLTYLWPESWAWHANQSPYLTLILGMYMVLGAMLMLASQNPQENMSLIWFTIFSSIVHGCIMSVVSYQNPEEWGHFYGEVPVLFFCAAVLLYLKPETSTQTSTNKTARKTQ